MYENDRGIRLADGDNTHVHDSVSFGNIQAGIYLSATTGATGPTSPGMTNSVVENNQSYGNANNGILVVGGDKITVRGNDVHDNWNSGVMVWYPPRSSSTATPSPATMPSASTAKETPATPPAGESPSSVPMPAPAANSPSR